MRKTTLAEQFRPRVWKDVVGQDAVVKKLGMVRDRSGFAGRAFWITGKSGTGKTSIAYLIADDVADDLGLVELDASGLTPARVVEIEKSTRCRLIGDRPGHAVIVNEAHGLRRDTVRQLLVTLERIPEHVVWVFTTTNDGQQELFDECEDAGPLTSRCLTYRLTNQGLANSFAKRALKIAQSEGLDGQPLAEYVKLVKKCRNNMRAVLGSIEAGEMIR